MLGCPDFTNCYNTTTPSTFSQPFTLHYEDMGMNQGRLYILDHYWNRILAGITTSGASSTILKCLDGNTSSACEITGNVNVVEQQSLLFNATELQVQGDIVFSNSSKYVLLDFFFTLFTFHKLNFHSFVFFFQYFPSILYFQLLV